MNIDHILTVMNQCQVAYLLIGGVNFLLRHQPVLTYDIDLWIEDTPDNLARCERALAQLQAQWGAAMDDWGPVAQRPSGWLSQQPLFCLASPFGAIDIFRTVAGLDDWQQCKRRAVEGVTGGGVPYRGLCDADMLRCQLALPADEQNLQRIAILRQALGNITNANQAGP